MRSFRGRRTCLPRFADAPGIRHEAVVELVENAGVHGLPRPLTEHELGMIDQAADFREGRTFTVDGARAYVEARRAEARISR